jgi:WxL interacting protein linking bacterial and host surfaces
MRLPRLRRCAAGLASLAAAASLLGLPAPASAAGPTFALKPATEAKLGYFVLAGQPGATLRGKVEVANVGSKAGSTSLYAVDATTGATSGAVYRSKQEPRRDVGSWIKLARSTVELMPGESTVVPFSVRVPDEAFAGQHLGGIVAQRSSGVIASKVAQGGKKKSGFTVNIQALSVLAVQVNVPGPEQPRMTLTGIKPGSQPGHQSLLLGIGNAGNVLVKGSGSLKVVNHAGRQVQSQSFNLDTFVPKTQIDFPVYIQGKALPAGRYRGTVTIDYRGRSLSRAFPFTITAGQVAQVFGTTASQPTPGDPSPNNGLLYAFAAITLLSLGAAFYFWRSRRPA